MAARTDDNGDQSKRDNTRLVVPERVLRSQDEILESWKWDDERPIVSICCAAYNHEHFIKDALDSFLMQETDFPIEILVNDDASLDSTADVIRDYERAYPLIVKPTYQRVNQYSLGIKPLPQLHARSKAKYIAVCEGDDFWTDPQKLAIQVAFLESNPSYVMSSHNARIIDSQNRVVSESKLPRSCQHDFSSTELVAGRAWVLTLSWMFRNVAIEFPVEMSKVQNGDVFYLSLLGQHGKCKYHPDIEPACYRVHNGGVWSSLPQTEQRAASINTRLWLYRYYARTNRHGNARECWNTFALKVLMTTSWLALLWGLVKIMWDRTIWACLVRK